MGALFFQHTLKTRAEPCLVLVVVVKSLPEFNDVERKPERSCSSSGIMQLIIAVTTIYHQVCKWVTSSASTATSLSWPKNIRLWNLINETKNRFLFCYDVENDKNKAYLSLLFSLYFYDAIFWGSLFDTWTTRCGLKWSSRFANHPGTFRATAVVANKKGAGELLRKTLSHKCWNWYWILDWRKCFSQKKKYR